MKYVILGASGTLGSNLSKNLSLSGHDVIDITRDKFNAYDVRSVDSILERNTNSIVVNCIAFMPADKCELNPEESIYLNFHIVEEIWKACQKYNCKFIVFSSDFVFDGKKSSPYLEDDLTSPISIYGEHKSKLESFVRDENSDDFKCVRFSSLIALNKGRTFVEKIVQRAKQTGSIQVVKDLQISITSYELISEFVTKVLFNSQNPISNVSHFGVTDWHNLATLVIEKLGITAEIKQISCEQMAPIAKRPQYSVLEPNPQIHKLDNRTWDIVVKDFIDKHKSELIQCV